MTEYRFKPGDKIRNTRTKNVGRIRSTLISTWGFPGYSVMIPKSEGGERFSIWADRHAVLLTEEEYRSAVEEMRGQRVKRPGKKITPVNPLETPFAKMLHVSADFWRA